MTSTDSHPRTGSRSRTPIAERVVSVTIAHRAFRRAGLGVSRRVATIRGEAGLAFGLGGALAIVIIAIAVPIITPETAQGMRWRVNGVGTLLLVIALPLVAWGLDLLLWFV